jgi:hypothetical protein
MNWFRKHAIVLGGTAVAVSLLTFTAPPRRARTGGRAGTGDQYGGRAGDRQQYGRHGTDSIPIPSWIYPQPPLFATVGVAQVLSKLSRRIIGWWCCTLQRTSSSTGRRVRSTSDTKGRASRVGSLRRRPPLRPSSIHFSSNLNCRFCCMSTPANPFS